MSKKSSRVRIKIYSIEEIFNFLKNNPFTPEPNKPRWMKQKQYYVDSEGNKMSVRRARVFFEKGTACYCGLRGQFFALERHNDGGLHLDLYAKNEFGHEVLMTIDHIHPASKGGQNRIENYEPMCWPHNKKKADTVPSVTPAIS